MTDTVMGSIMAGLYSRDPMLGLLVRLLRDAPAALDTGDIRPWWHAVTARLPREVLPIDQAIVAGFSGDRVAAALAGGYQAALRALIGGVTSVAPPPWLPWTAIASFCATEQGGNHPRAIQTSVTPLGADRRALSGAKRWSTMGPVADVLLVVASEGTDDGGRNRLRLVRVETSSPGLTIGRMPATPAVPEVPHGAIELDRVEVPATAVLTGDGYALHVKPFRTVEDLHIHGALLGYVLSVARRHAFEQAAVERIVAALAATRALAVLDPAAAEVHVALAGLLDQDARLLADLDGAWSRVPDAERERWRRDRALFGSVAGQLRERRRQRAWETIAGSPAGAGRRRRPNDSGAPRAMADRVAREDDQREQGGRGTPKLRPAIITAVSWNRRPWRSPTPSSSSELIIQSPGSWGTPCRAPTMNVLSRPLAALAEHRERSSSVAETKSPRSAGDAGLEARIDWAVTPMSPGCPTPDVALSTTSGDRA